MDIKELMKFQFVSQMNSNATSNINGMSLYASFMNFIMFMLMSFVDDIVKSLPGLFGQIKTKIGGYCSTKVKETIEFKPKTLADTSVSLSTRHFVNRFVMKRIYRNNDSSNGSSGSSGSECSNLEESNAMVDAILSKISKLNNIPTIDLIDKGNFMITYKEKPIQISRELFVKIDNVDIGTNGSINSLKMSLLSNTMSAAEIGKYVKEVYVNYLQEVKNSLGNNIYFFDQKSKDGNAPPPPPSSDPGQLMQHKRMLINTAPKQLSFTMMPFYSNKQFSNIYGPEVKLIEKRIKFFIDNKDWYDSKGIPYQLGILLSGIPGAGKTSVIRAIANYTKRHIINVNFANITTATQLKNLFYSDKVQVYTDQSMSATQSYFIPVDQRIYVLEEIDAIGNIVKQRKDDDVATSTVNDELTLMEILTVLDGTMEIPGRIVVMTTNHPEILDAALIRPGRIDVKVSFGYSSRQLTADMFKGYFDFEFPIDKIDMLPDKVLSPAEIGQVFFRHFDEISNEDDIEVIIKDLQDTAANCGRISKKRESNETIISEVVEDKVTTPVEDKVITHVEDKVTTPIEDNLITYVEEVVITPTTHVEDKVITPFKDKVTTSIKDREPVHVVHQPVPPDFVKKIKSEKIDEIIAINEFVNKNTKTTNMATACGIDKFEPFNFNDDYDCYEEVCFD
jgi:SpoVK/Ycf46/Vps4 family AAA+-type ATPase